MAIPVLQREDGEGCNKRQTAQDDPKTCTHTDKQRIENEQEYDDVCTHVCLFKTRATTKRVAPFRSVTPHKAEKEANVSVESKKASKTRDPTTDNNAGQVRKKLSKVLMWTELAFISQWVISGLLAMNFAGATAKSAERKVELNSRPSTYIEALQLCNQSGGHLPVITSETEVGLLSTISIGFWVKMKRKIFKDFRWLDMDVCDFDKQDLRVLDSYKCGQLNIDGGNKLDPSLLLSSASCQTNTTGIGYVCQINGTCDSQSDCYELDGYAYVFKREGATWEEARDDCIKNGGDLAIMKSKKTILSVATERLKDEITFYSYWIGFSKEMFVCDTGADTSRRLPWMTGEPCADKNKQCVTAHRLGRSLMLRSESCSNSNRVVCVYPEKEEPPQAFTTDANRHDIVEKKEDAVSDWIVGLAVGGFLSLLFLLLLLLLLRQQKFHSSPLKGLALLGRCRCRDESRSTSETQQQHAKEDHYQHLQQANVA